MNNGNCIHLGASAKVASDSAHLAELAGPDTNNDLDTVNRPAVPWYASAVWGAVLCAAYPVLAIAPVIALHGIENDGGHSTVTELGINCALVGFMLLSMQFVLTARLPWVEAPFGLDLVLRFHRAMAFVIMGLLCAHPLLIAGAEGWALLTRFHAHWPIWAGRIALILLLAQVAAALLRGAMRMPYERWRRAHTAIAVVILALGFAHAVKTSDDLRGIAPLMLWATAPMLALAALVHSHVIRPRLLARRAFRVQSVKLEAPRVWTVTLETPAGRPLHFLPGQFQFLRLLDSTVPAEEHPFTIASSPSMADRISLTIKGCGNFTTLIDRIQPGDRATVHGPFGRFSHDLHPDESHLVFVAGGVGITPFMSMLRAMGDRRQSLRVTLVYANRTLDDVLFASELVAMEAGQRPAFKVVYVLSEPPAWWTGQTGRIDARRLNQWCGGVGDKAFYLCCPPSMNVALVRGLRRHGVSPRRIHCDYFSL